jgi:hypothetical protein
MKVGLFIPCYIDAFFPEVGVATLELLEKLGWSVEYPLDQTCCGQPMANSGCQDDAAATEAHFVGCFKDFATVVGPSGSCVHLRPLQAARSDRQPLRPLHGGAVGHRRHRGSDHSRRPGRAKPNCPAPCAARNGPMTDKGVPL